MKKFRLTLREKGDTKNFCIYAEVKNEEEARKYFENNFNRFNELVKIKEV